MESLSVQLCQTTGLATLHLNGNSLINDSMPSVAAIIGCLPETLTHLNLSGASSLSQAETDTTAQTFFGTPHMSYYTPWSLFCIITHDRESNCV